MPTPRRASGKKQKVGKPTPTLSEVQKQQRRQKKAVAAFRPRKSERGKIVFVGVEGGRPKNKHNKGWAVYITKGGKKKPLKSTKGLRPQTRAELSLKVNRVIKRAMSDFEQSQLVQRLSGGAVVKKSLGPTKKGNLFKGEDEKTISQAANYGRIHKIGDDFNDAVVTKLAKNLKDAFDNTRAFRHFVIRTMMLIETPEGELKVIEFSVPIARREKTEVALGGLKNFVRLKFYSFLAKQLAFLGYVSSGSANHIRRLPENKGEHTEDWTKDGHQWEGRYKEQVHIRTIQWQILQS